MGLFSFQVPRRSGAQGRTACLALAAAGCAALLSAQPVHAQQVTAVFSQSGGFFNYNFIVQNPTAVTLADVSVATGASLITNRVPPTGFQIAYDANGLGTNQGVVDFLTTDGTRDFFANTTVSGFLLRSSTNLNGAAFSTFDVNGNTVNGIVTAVAAPEPGTLGLLAFGATPAAGAFLAFRRRFVSSVSLKG